MAIGEKRKRFRIGLRTCLILTLLLGVTVCFWSWLWNRAERQRIAVNWVKTQGGTVFYDFQYDEKTSYFRREMKPDHIPEWLIAWFGVDMFCEVTDVSIGRVLDPSSTPETLDIKQITNFRKLRSLNITNSRIKNITPLVDLIELETLTLHGDPSKDLLWMRKLKKLRNLYMNGENYESFSGLENLENLRAFYYNGRKINDTSALGSLPNLEHIMVFGSTKINLSHLKNLNLLQGLYITIKSFPTESEISFLKNLPNLQGFIHLESEQTMPQKQKNKLKRELPNLNFQYR